MAVAVAGAGAPAAIDWEVPEQVGLWSDAWRRFRRNKVAVIGLCLVGILVLDAIASALLSTTGHYLWADPFKQDVNNIFAGSSAAHPFGQDELGRDVFARVLKGAEISMQIGLLTQLIILVIGGLVGLTAGYFGGWVDNLLMRFTDVMYAFPDLLFIIVVVAAMGRSLLSIFVAISVVNWVNLARLIRGQVLQLREKEFVEGARASGSTPLKIILKHLLPNSLGPIIVSLTFGIPQAIFLEAVLSYLGAGLPPPTPSWGVMTHDGYDAISADPVLVIFPAIAIAITMLSFTFIGDGLRDALDPRMRK
ncbi:MAG: oligopeptide transport system permease protein [Chloroflexota bacterium]|jgi:oligopeptide transport system permease protein|nr:oligopeptide transport system permease protein [Chloroflexota bacterium]